MLVTKNLKSRILTPSTLATISDTPPNSNMESVCAGIDARGIAVGLDLPHRLAQYVAQITHESARFRYDREIWDGKGAQARYDIRTDLGNTPERDGDGFKYRGRTAIQITGKDNTREFFEWCSEFGSPPDFVADPDAMNTDPWEGLGPIWYWDTRGLNRFADRGSTEMITRRINGGLNGYQDRLALYTRAALVMMGRRPEDVRGFQAERGIATDGIAGPQTRGHLHFALLDLPPLSVEPATSPAPQDEAGGNNSIASSEEGIDGRATLGAVRRLIDKHFAKHPIKS